MQLPPYWLPRPAYRPDRETTTRFDRLLDRALDHGPDQPVDYRLDAPKWQFLCHAAERATVVLHGSGDPGVARWPLMPPTPPISPTPWASMRT